MSDIYALAQRYQSALQAYLAGVEEPALQQAYELGRQALGDGLGIQDVVTVHGEALVRAVLHTSTPGDSAQVARRAMGFLLESVSAFEMIDRGFREANAALRRINATLELRSAELEAANQDLARDADQYATMLATAPDGFWRFDASGKLLDVNDVYCRMTGYSRDELLSLNISDIEVLEKPEDTARHIRMIRGTGFDRFESQHRKKDGGILDVEISVSFWRAAGQFLMFARDITERKRAEEELRRHHEHLEELVRERTRELEAANAQLRAEIGERERAEARIHQQNVVLQGINRVFRETLTCDTEEELGRTCLAIVEDVTQSQVGFIGEINQEGRLDDIAISNPGWAACEMADKTGHRKVPTGFEVRGIYGRVFLDGKSLFTNDPPSHPDRIGMPEGHPPLRAFLGVPLIQGGRVIGMIGLGNREGGYRAEDLETLEALAPAIVQVLMRKRAEDALRRQVQIAAGLEERQRLARDLHDSVSQALYGIALGAQTGRRLLERTPEQVGGSLDYILSLASMGLTEMRALIFDLRPESLATEGLVAALTRRANFIQAQQGIQVSVELGQEPDLPVELKETLHSIAREALHNTVKHAHAHQVELRLRQDQTTLTLEIKDDGVGFDPTLSFAGHLGLQSMRERVAYLRGTLETESAPGHGTRILVRVPLRRVDGAVSLA